MMYNNKLAIAVKSHGKVLRETKDCVYVPFGSEYSILVKNLNSVRASVKVAIDGTDVTDGAALVISPNGELELERFIKDRNLNKGNKFKFIERSAHVEDNRGIKVEDGLIRVEFQYEQVVVQEDVIKIVHEKVKIHRDYEYYDDYWYWHRPYSYRPYPYVWYGSSWGIPCGGSSGGVGSSLSSGGTTGLMSGNNAQQLTGTYTNTGGKGSSLGGVVSANAMTNSAPVMDSVYNAGEVNVNFVQTANDAGITVPGAVSEQKFGVSDYFPLQSQSYVIVLKMLGTNEKGKLVVKPITVKSKIRCTTCRHVNHTTGKFCTQCGTSLEIV